jgi:hypothetical protein
MRTRSRRSNRIWNTIRITTRRRMRRTRRRRPKNPEEKEPSKKKI